jgi:hypothetical protein
MKNNKKNINEQGLGSQAGALFKNGDLKMAVQAGCFSEKVQPFSFNGTEVAYVTSTKYPGFPLAYMYPDGKLEYYSNDGKSKMEKTLRWNCNKVQELKQNSLNPTLIKLVDEIKAAGTADVYNYGDETLGAKKVDGSCTLTKFSDFLEGNPNLKSREDVKNILPTSAQMYIWVCQQGAKVAVDRAAITKALELGYRECTDLDLSSNLSNVKFYSEDGKTPTLLNGKKYCWSYRQEEGLTTRLKPYREASQAVGEKGTTKETCRAMILAYYNAAKEGLPLPTEEIQLGKSRLLDCQNNETIKLDGFLSKKFEKMQQDIRTFPIKTAPDGISKLDYRLSLTRGQMESKEVKLKNMIRENLVNLSNSKQKTLLGEQTVITTRYSIIKESGKPKNRTQRLKLTDELISETFYLNSQGFNNELINEEFLDVIKGLFGNAGEGVFSYIKERFANFIVTKLTPMDPNGWAANILITAVGNIPIGDYMTGKVFSCDYISDVLSKSVAEGALRKVQNDKGMGGPLYDILRNAIVESLEDTKFGSAIENAIGDLVCPLLGGIKSKMNLAGDAMKEKALS